MLEKLTKTVTQFFGIIAGVLSGLGAIVTAIGYLAERSHLKMLGFTEIPVDLNQYLYTGALFLAGFPSLIVALVWENLNKWALLCGLIMFLSVWRGFIIAPTLPIWRLRLPNRDSVNAVIRKSEIVIRKSAPGLLALLVVWQFSAIKWGGRAMGLDNLLFDSQIYYHENIGDQHTPYVDITSDTLKMWLLDQKHNPIERWEQLKLYFLQLTLVFLATVLALRGIIIKSRAEGDTKRSPFQTTLLVINMILLALQAFLIPINYGILLHAKSYAEVQVTLEPTKDQLSGQESTQGVMPNRNVDRITAQNSSGLSQESGSFVLLRSGEKATYFLHIEQAGIFRIELAGTVDEATSERLSGRITAHIQASDRYTNVEPDSTSFEFSNDQRGDDQRPERREGYEANKTKIADQVMSLGDPALVLNMLDRSPISDLEDSWLRYSASATPLGVVEVPTALEELRVYPLSEGETELTVTAYDSKDQQPSEDQRPSFHVRVVNDSRTWPKQERLLLLYQSKELLYFYSRQERRIFSLLRTQIKSMVYYGRTELFRP